MPEVSFTNNKRAWSISGAILGLLIVYAGGVIWAFFGGLEAMVNRWDTSEEYGYGYLIPLIVGFFIWQKKNDLARLEFTGSWLGVLIFLTSGLLLVAGELATIFTLIQYAFVLAVFGIVLALLGLRASKEIFAALIMLLFMIPLPAFLYNGLSSELQLISSKLGVMVIRLLDISVYLEGNVIDLGNYKLQVVEACSGLRYLFPLACLSFIAAYLFRGAYWKKVIIFLSSIPITVFMNSFRIGVIGILVEYWGSDMAEGFLHDFEGWVVFMGCMGILIFEMWILAKIGKDKKSLMDAFLIESPGPLDVPDENIQVRAMPAPFIALLPVMLAMAIVPVVLQGKDEIIPERKNFASFPMNFDGWAGQKSSLEQIFIDTLKFDDYIIANYSSDTLSGLSFYVAYYGSQRAGESAHSPRSCIPGDGWVIASHDEVNVDVMAKEGGLNVNRLIIRKGDVSQLVYYWFEQRGRNITNEYLVKWYLFWDSLTQNRSDGALIRITTVIRPEDDVNKVESELQRFVNDIYQTLDQYVPD